MQQEGGQYKVYSKIFREYLFAGKCTQNSRSVSGRVCVYSALLLPGFQYINHNHCLTAIQDSSSIHHRLWFISLQLFAIISNYLKVCAIICNYLQLSKGVWDDRRSCAWLGSPSLWLGDGKQSCLNIVLSVVAILHQYMFQYLTNVCSNIYFIHFFWTKYWYLIEYLTNILYWRWWPTWWSPPSMGWSPRSQLLSR